MNLRHKNVRNTVLGPPGSLPSPRGMCSRQQCMHHNENWLKQGHQQLWGRPGRGVLCPAPTTSCMQTRYKRHSVHSDHSTCGSMPRPQLQRSGHNNGSTGAHHITSCWSAQSCKQLYAAHVIGTGPNLQALQPGCVVFSCHKSPAHRVNTRLDDVHVLSKLNHTTRAPHSICQQCLCTSALLPQPPTTRLCQCDHRARPCTCTVQQSSSPLQINSHAASPSVTHASPPQPQCRAVQHCKPRGS